MGDRTLTRASYSGVMSAVQHAGSATHRGEERMRQGRGLDPLVDPSGYGLIRRSLPRFQKEAGKFRLTVGIPMLIEVLLDTTGSMGDNVDIALEVLPLTYDLLAAGKNPVLGRYDTQIITAIFGDTLDRTVLCRSQAEMDVKIAEQMTMMVPEHGGHGNGHENPEYGLFGAAYLTAARINAYGLKSYHFTISDEPLVEIYDPATLRRVYGNSVFETLKENGHDFHENELPGVGETIQVLQSNAHAFFLQVGERPDVLAQWSRLYGIEHVIALPSTRLLPQVEAAIIGLTEGVLDLQSIGEFLEENNVNKEDARRIARSVSNIPIGAQAVLPNFDKIPMKGALFASKTDLWPVGESEASEVPEQSVKEEEIWL